MKGFRRFLLLRVVAFIPTILGLIILTFFLSHIIPGNPALVLGGQEVVTDPAELKVLVAELGLNKPLYVQFYIYIVQLLHFNLGYSYYWSQPITYELGIRFPASIELAFAAMVIGIPVGIYAGIYSALRANQIGDHATRILSLLAISMPVFWIGIVMIVIFYSDLHIAPAPFGQLSPLLTPPSHITGFVILDSLLSGNIPDFANALWHIVLPAVVLSFAIIAVLARVVRASMLDVVNKDYMRTAFAIGLPRNILINKYALRNALLPTITVTAIQMGALMGGVVLTETIFSWPGLGLYTYDSILNLDYGSIMAVVILSGVVFVIVNFLADILYGVVDPRVRY
ncbi:MAG: ABC transporter permease [Thermoplasmatales archaeon]|jgi:peptide/nickel transport system permease protein|nr:ABC transporter permease [Candidatus Thermoplasmatota archaeon]MDA8054592.1 ABC transporter permease [Thermoplasmatales archaeon]